EFLVLLGHLGGEVAALADILAQVVEFAAAVLEELDQLEVAGPDRAGGGRAPAVPARAEAAGEVPVDRLPAEVALAGGGPARDDAQAVERLVGRALGAGEGREGRVQVHAQDRLGAGR